MNISPTKKVSVVVPNYNYGRYLKKRIKTIISQTYPIYELIVLDDGSTDGSVKKLRGLLENLRGVTWKIIENEKNSGKAILQWKKGIEAASGDFIWIAEADDLCSRDFLRGVMKGFDDPEVVLSYSESMLMNARGVVIAPNFRWSRDKEKTGHFKKSYVKDGKNDVEEIMAIRCTIPNVSAVVFRNSPKLTKYLAEASKFSQVGDWYFYTKVLENGKICYNRKSLNKFRIHKGSATKEANKSGEHYKEVVEMHEYFRKKYKLSERVLRAIDEEESRIRAKHDIIK